MILQKCFVFQDKPLVQSKQESIIHHWNWLLQFQTFLVNGLKKSLSMKDRIEQHDELKTKIRDRAGRYAYGIGLVVICFSILVFSILGALEVIDNARMIILYLSGYLMFQIITGIIIFNKLMKKY